MSNHKIIKSRGGVKMVNEQRMKRILKMYSNLFEVVPNPDSNGHPGVTIYYKNKQHIQHPVLFNDICTLVSFNKRIFVMDSTTKYSASLCLMLNEVAGSMYIHNNSKLFDEFCIALDDYNIVIHNTVSDTDLTPLYDIPAIRRRQTIKEILDEQ